jgi:hypothetical protein
MSGKALCSSKRPPKDWTPFKVGAYGFVGRIGEAAMNGGAAWDDVWQMMIRLGFDLTLNEALTYAAPLAAERQMMKYALANKESRVADAERERVTAANKLLVREFPGPTERYREIAKRLEMKDTRVRYIIEGPRRRKK